jgi:YD repeat-containing protein
MRTMIHPLQAFTLTALASPVELAGTGHSSNREADIAGCPPGARRPFRLIWVTWIAAAVLTACGGSGGSGSAPPPAPTISSIAVAPEMGTPSTTYTGDTLQLTATATYSDSSTKDITATATWASSNSAIATTSKTGLVASVAAGQVNISAAMSGVSGTDTITVNAKTLLSISVAPGMASLALAISQQYWATGAYNDGSSGDVTKTVVWSSSSPSVASVASNGTVTTLAQGNTNISASLGSLQASAQLAVSSASGGAVLVNDLTDMRLISMQGTDGSLVTLYGTRDASGNPSTATALSRVNTDGTQQEFTFDSQGRLTRIVLGDNSQFLYAWAPDGSAMVTVVTSDGTTALSAALPASAAMAARRSKPLSNPSFGSANAVVSAHVTSCNGTVDEDWASVQVYPPGGLIPAQLVAPGTGSYQALLPSGPTPGPLQVASAITSVPCKLSTIVSVTCGVVTAAVVVAGDGIPLLEAGAIYASCTDLGVAAAVFSNICTAITAGHILNSSINWLAGQAPLPISASLNSNSTAQLTYQTLINPSNGLYPKLEVGFACPLVDHVNVWPSSTSLGVGQSLPMAATAVDGNGKILLSSAFMFDWSSPDFSIVSAGPPGAPGPVGSGHVTGVAPGGPVHITATETSSHKQGTSAVTVLKYSFVTLNYPGATSTFPMAINNVGQVVGYWVNPGQATSGNFLYSEGNFSSISTPGTLSTPTGINDNGQIVGTYYPDYPGNQYLYHGFLYSGGSYTTIDYPGAYATSVNGINASGQIVGCYTAQEGGGSQIFLYSGGSFSTIVYPDHPYVTSLTGINTSGLIVGEEFNYLGWNGFVDSAGTFISITDPVAGPSGPLTYANGINDSGEVAGTYIDQAQAEHGFIYSGGSYTTIDYPGAPLGTPIEGTKITGINNSGQIIGYGDGSGGAFLGIPQ